MTKPKLLLNRALLCLFAVGVTAASAAPVSYSESVSGDLPVLGTPLTTFVFDIGANTISGNTGRTALDATDFDSFAFTIPAGDQLVAAQLQITDAVGHVDRADWQFNSGSLNWSGGQLLTFILGSPPGIYVFSSGVLGAGNYNISASSLSFEQNAPAQSTANYTFTFTVSAVALPEPPALALLAVILGGLGFGRRKRAS